MLGVGDLDQLDMVGEFRQPVVGAEGDAHVFRRLVGRGAADPLRLEAELSVGMAESPDEMRGLEIRLHVEPLGFLQRLEVAKTAFFQHVVDMLALGHAEARHVGDAEAFAQFLDDEVVGARPLGRVDQFRAEIDVLVAAAAIDVVMFEEHGGGQHDVGEFCRVGHELLVHAGEQVVAQKALLHQALLGRDVDRVGVLDEQRGDRRAAVERILVAHQHRADARMVEIADLRGRAAWCLRAGPCRT